MSAVQDCQGSGTDDDPYLVAFSAVDPGDPQQHPRWKKWMFLIIMALATLSVAFVSSAYSGGVEDIVIDFKVSEEVAILGISLFVLGFAIGPLLWAPLSEMYGRRILYVITFFALSAFSAGAAASQNIQTLLVLRALGGTFGSSPLTNCGGVIADVFSREERGLSTSLFAAMPFMGPVLGPVVGGFVGESLGWRWNQGLMGIFTGLLFVLGSIFVPETYAPVILRWRAKKLSKETGKVYVSSLDAATRKSSDKGSGRFRTALTRPLILLTREPIVLSMSIYLAIVYGTLYLMFAAFPIVFQQQRHWSPGISGLAFLGIFVGVLAGLVLNFLYDRHYIRIAKQSPGGVAPPEARLPPSILASVAIPAGLFWFAWSNGASTPWIVCIIGSGVFGFGMVLVFLSMMMYLIDSYTIYAASVLAANSLLRSLCGAAFPLFTADMYANLGVHWASSVPAFLSLACVPFPFLFYRYGAFIRSKCPYAAHAAEAMKLLTAGTGQRGDEQAGSESAQPDRDRGGSVTDVDESVDGSVKDEEMRPPGDEKV